MKHGETHDNAIRHLAECVHAAVVLHLLSDDNITLAIKIRKSGIGKSRNRPDIQAIMDMLDNGITEEELQLLRTTPSNGYVPTR